MGGIVFFGTPDFAVPTLDALCAADLAPVLVVSRPDRPVGRGRSLASPPVVEAARRWGLEVAQPEGVRGEDLLGRLRALEPDLAVVVAFGRIFPAALLTLPRRGCLNVHASLLPRHRGASPIQAAILAGDRVSGVSIMQMDEGLDSGPVLFQLEAEIGTEETAGELAERLARAGAQALLACLPDWLAGRLVARPQPTEGVTVAPLVRKQDGVVDWAQDAVAIERRLRAFTPWPGLTTTFGGAPLRLIALEVVAGDDAGGAPGTVVEIDPRGLRVACGGGSSLRLGVLQRPGRKPLAVRDFLNGEPIAVGARLG